MIGWEIGNESNLKNKGANRIVTPAILDSHAETLIKLVEELYTGGARGNGTNVSPYVIGPDVTHAAISNG